jgi:WD40 repeat protein/DNA-binding SARP family transcriptional activator
MGVFEAAQERPLGGPKQRLVLAHLLVRANQAVPVDRLIAAVWDEPPATARGSVQSYVSHLRKTLGADRIDSNGQGYVLRVEPHELDRSRFEALVSDARRLRATDPAAAAAMLREALALWRGSPFADLADAASLQPEITRLTELRLAAVEDRVAAELDAGAPRDVVGELEALTAEHPLRERLWELLIIALYRSGRQADALQAYERARRRLADELGIDPSEELQTLHQRVLRQDPALRGATVMVKGYQLVERLGQDAFGVTWLATQPGVERDVAIKIARPELANDPAFIRRFDADAQRVARIEHPHVVPVYDFWREPSGAYIVTRHLRGGSLRALLDRSGPPDRAAALRIATQLTGALAAAHRRGVVHGGLTTSHVLLDEEGNAYLNDLGIARMSGDAGRSPAEGPRRAPTGDHRDLMLVDVRALGAVLSPLLTGDEGPVRDVLGRIAEPAVSGDDGPTLLTDLRVAITDEAGTSPAPATAPVASVRHNPYKGLRAFTESDADDFFGRDAVVAQLLSRLRADGYGARFLAVVGPSGSGKSSVVRAGLVPALRAGAVPGSDKWFVAQLVPGGRPFDELATALRHIAVDAPDDLATRLAGPEGLSGVLPQLLPDDADLLLVVDQFEELFTLVADDDRRLRFIAMLVGAVNGPSSRVRAVVTLRADFYDRPLEQGELGALTRARTEAIAPMTAAELERAITAPAERAEVTVERRLVAQMVADVVDQPGALPLLQYALTELFDRRYDAMLTVASYRDIGGVAGALARRAETTYVGLREAGQRACRDLFLRLVTPGEGVEDTRRREEVAEVTALAPDTMPGVLDAFGDARLLSFDRDPETRAPTVEVAHEALLREWRRLRGWIDAARDDLRTHRRLQTAAADWTAADRDPSYLATGAQLAQYEVWRASSGLTATAQEQQYLDASVAHRDRAAAEETSRRQRELDLERRSVGRLRILVAVLGVAALVAGGLTVVAITQGRRAADQTVRAQDEALRAEREARVATARELAAAADANLDVDAERSMLLAIAAIDATRSAGQPVLRQAEEALHRAVGSSRAILRVRGIGGSLDWSPDGETFVTEGADVPPDDERNGVIDVRDAETGASVHSWRGHDADVSDVIYSPDGTSLLTAGDDGALRLWDPATGELRAEYVEGGTDEAPQVLGASFSPDGRHVAGVWVSDDRDVLRVLDADTAEVTVEVEDIGTPLESYRTAFSPEGDEIAIGSWDRGRVEVYDTITGERRRALAAGPDTGAAWSPDGKLIAATGAGDAAVYVFDADSGALRFTLTGHAAGVRHIDWSHDARRLASAGGDGTVRIWEVSDTGVTEEAVLAADLGGGAFGVAFSPDADAVMSGDATTSTVLGWDVGNAPPGEVASFPAPSAAWTTIVPASDGSQVVAPGTRNAASSWIARSGENASHYGRNQPGVAVAAGTGLIAAAGDNNVVRGWDAGSGDQLFAVDPPDPERPLVVGVDVSRDGAAIAAGYFAGRAVVYDASGRDRASYEVSEDGHTVENVAVSPDGAMVAVIEYRGQDGSGQVTLWDPERREVVYAIDGAALSATFSHDGGMLAIAQRDGTATVWNVDDATLIATASGHVGPATNVAFDSTGATIATTGFDGTVRLWDAKTGAARLELPGHDAESWDATFLDDNRLLATIGSDGVGRVWALDVDDLIGIAESKLTRGLIDAECREYLHQDACP